MVAAVVDAGAAEAARPAVASTTNVSRKRPRFGANLTEPIRMQLGAGQQAAAGDSGQQLVTVGSSSCSSSSSSSQCTMGQLDAMRNHRSSLVWLSQLPTIAAESRSLRC